MANTKKEPRKQNATDEKTGDDSPIVGAVEESPRSSDETNASDPVASSGVAREERDSPSASGLPADDPDAGEARKKAYKDGATLVSRID